MKEPTWTKEQYLDWLQRRGKAGTWTHKDCSQADRHIHEHAMREFLTKLGDTPEPIRSFVIICAHAHYGSVECDQMLTALKCYPEWMKQE